MIIWHVGADPVPENVNGVNTTIWTVAKAQAEAGHEIVLLLADAPPPATAAFAAGAGIRLLHVPGSRWSFDRAMLRRAAEARPPQIVHMHSVFIPRQVGLAWLMRRLGIPYVITPNGGVNPHILARGKAKKSLYGTLFEKPRFRHAAAVTAVMPAEVQEIAAYAPGHRLATPIVPNPIDAASLSGASWTGSNTPRLVYLGRLDIEHKGIDRLVAIAKLLPDVEFVLYGPQGASSQSLLAELQAPSNVVIRPSVHGAAKLEVLTTATAYLQTSRWEAFGVSVAEAMFLGVPCAVMRSMNIAELIGATGAGLVLPEDPAAAAAALSAWLGDAEALAASGRRAREVARSRFAAATVAEAYLRVYEDVTSGWQGQGAEPFACRQKVAVSVQ